MATGDQSQVDSIRLIIDSRLENVRLVGMAVNRLCAAAGLNETEAFSAELCVVEAVTNCVEHAYGGRSGHEVETVAKFYAHEIVFEVRDTGRPMAGGILEAADACRFDEGCDSFQDLPTRGRGLAIIKEIMGRVTYTSEAGANCLRMTMDVSAKQEESE